MAQKKKGITVKPAGIIFMIVSWAFILSLAVFCFYKIFTKKKID